MMQFLYFLNMGEPPRYLAMLNEVCKNSGGGKGHLPRNRDYIVEFGVGAPRLDGVFPAWQACEQTVQQNSVVRVVAGEFVQISNLPLGHLAFREVGPRDLLLNVSLVHDHNPLARFVIREATENLMFFVLFR